MPQSLDDLYRAAIALHQQGHAKEARRAYDRLLDKRPDHYGALHLKGVLALQAGDYAAAIDLIQRSLRIEPRHALALSNLSVALRAKGRLSEAIAALEKSIAVGPATADALTNLSQTQQEAGLTALSVETARKAIALNPDRLGARQFMVFGTNYLAELDPQALTADARDYGALAARQLPPRTDHEMGSAAWFVAAPGPCAGGVSACARRPGSVSCVVRRPFSFSRASHS